jgi:hypothetical protein
VRSPTSTPQPRLPPASRSPPEPVRTGISSRPTDGEMSAREVRRQTCNESRPWSDRLLIKPSERAEPASPPAVDGHINCKASADHHRSMVCGAESLRSHDHNRGGTNSASQPQASQHEPYRSLISSTVRINHRRHWLDQVFAYPAVGAPNRLAEGSPASCASAIIPMVGTSRQQPDRASPPKCSAARGAQSVIRIRLRSPGHGHRAGREDYSRGSGAGRK